MSPDEDNEIRKISDRTAASSPLERERYAWPTIEVDPVEKMRALASSLPYVGADETVFDVPFDPFWRFIEDLETNTPRIESTVNRLEILDRNGDRLRLKARSPIGVWDEFDVVLRPGFCIMQGRSGQIGMAARPESETTTRYFHFEGTKILGRIGRPFFAWNVRQDFRRLRKLLRAEI
jgi:hypothetical protein